MAKSLQIENAGRTTILDLATDTAICVNFGEGGNRGLKTGGAITRVFRFRITGSTKANARANVNTFIARLRDAIKSKEDVTSRETFFLVESADGESPVRSLILDYEASAVAEGTAIDAYQSMNTPLYVDVAITLQNHKEEQYKEELAISSSTTGVAVGVKYYLASTGTGMNAPGRMNLDFEGNTEIVKKFWAGIMPSTGASFQHIWELCNGTLGTDTTLISPTADVYSGDPVYCSFATTAAMTDRVTITAAQHYTAEGLLTEADHDQARGEYILLCRCEVSGTGTILLRAGVEGSLGNVSYNEARLLESDGEFHYVNLGRITLPPRGARYDLTQVVGGIIAKSPIKIAAQRLTGTATLVLDTLCWIPSARHIFGSVSFGGDDRLVMMTDEFMNTVLVNQDKSAASATSFGQVESENNWLYPPDSWGVSGKTILVIAAEHDGEQIHDEDLDLVNYYVWQAVEAYHG